MSTFREFEHAGWEDPATCAAYHDRLGTVVVQAIEPLLDAVQVTAADLVLDVGTGAGEVAAAAAAWGAFVVGLDFSTEQLRRAGFKAASTCEIAQVWELATPDDAVEALLRGTIRLSALLRRQPAGVLDEIRYAVGEQLRTYDDGESVLAPMPAVMIHATRA